LANPSLTFLSSEGPQLGPFKLLPANILQYQVKSLPPIAE
jgi:hypothetical protein